MDADPPSGWGPGAPLRRVPCSLISATAATGSLPGVSASLCTGGCMRFRAGTSSSSSGVPASRAASTASLCMTLTHTAHDRGWRRASRAAALSAPAQVASPRHAVRGLAIEFTPFCGRGIITVAWAGGGMADAADLKSAGRKLVWVQVPPGLLGYKCSEPFFQSCPGCRALPQWEGSFLCLPPLWAQQPFTNLPQPRPARFPTRYTVCKPRSVLC